jgi:hypothetical protein
MHSTNVPSFPNNCMFHSPTWMVRQHGHIIKWSIFQILCLENNHLFQVFSNDVLLFQNLTNLKVEISNVVHKVLSPKSFVANN